MPAATDNDLVEKARAGCHASFEELVSRYEGRVYRFLRRQTGHEQDAEDLTQRTFVAAYQSLGRYRVGSRFSAWLFTIAGRLAISHFRARRPLEELSDEWPAPQAVMGGQEAQESLWEIARRLLSPMQFQALWLHYAEDFSVAEVARAMGKTRVHVKVLLHRGRRILGGYLKAEDNPGREVREGVVGGSDR